MSEYERPDRAAASPPSRTFASSWAPPPRTSRSRSATASARSSAACRGPPGPRGGRARDRAGSTDRARLRAPRPDPGTRAGASQLPRTGVVCAQPSRLGRLVPSHAHRLAEEEHGLGVQPPGCRERHSGLGRAIDCLRERAARGACRFTLLMPRARRRRGRRGSRRRSSAMREAGLEERRGASGRPRPGGRGDGGLGPDGFDEIVVSTLPTGVSRWLGLDLPHGSRSSPPCRSATWWPQPGARGRAGSRRRSTGATTACSRRSPAASRDASRGLLAATAPPTTRGARSPSRTGSRSSWPA